MIALLELFGVALTFVPVEWLMETVGEFYAPKPRPESVFATRESPDYYGLVAIRIVLTAFVLVLVAYLSWQLIKIWWRRREDQGGPPAGGGVPRYKDR